MDAEYLALIADAIGKPGEARAYRQECTAMIQRINDKLWNEELGVYCSRYWDEDGKPGAFLTRLTPMNFYPLIAGVPDSSRAGRVLKLMTDPKKFWASGFCRRCPTTIRCGPRRIIGRARSGRRSIISFSRG